MTWVDGAPLIVLEQNDSGIYPIAIWEIFCSLNVKICCSAALCHLVDLLIPYVEGKVGLKGSLKAVIYATCCCLQQHDAYPDLCISIQLEIHNVFNYGTVFSTEL